MRRRRLRSTMRKCLHLLWQASPFDNTMIDGPGLTRPCARNFASTTSLFSPFRGQFRRRSLRYLPHSPFIGLQANGTGRSSEVVISKPALLKTAFQLLPLPSRVHSVRRDFKAAIFCIEPLRSERLDYLLRARHRCAGMRRHLPFDFFFFFVESRWIHFSRALKRDSNLSAAFTHDAALMRVTACGSSCLCLCCSDLGLFCRGFILYYYFGPFVLATIGLRCPF